MPVLSFGNVPDSTPMQYGETDPRQQVADSSGNAPYATAGNPYAPKLDLEYGDTPDPQRIQRDNAPDMRQEPFQPRFWEKRGAESQERESVGRSRGIIAAALGIVRTVMPDPRANPPDNVRPLAATSPSTFRYTRPMTGGTPRTFTGEHFSMADHVRNFAPGEVFGMAPARSSRSGLRLDSAPWGEEVVDVPPAVDYTVNERYTMPVSSTARRSYRL